MEYPPAATESLRTALAAYEDLRARLAADSVEGVAERAVRLERSLAATSDALSTVAAPQAGAFVREGIAAAASLADAEDLTEARAAFGEVSRSMVALVAADVRLSEDLEIYSCPMTETFPKWIQAGGSLENPYMGPAMATCGAPADWAVPAPAGEAEAEAHAEHVHGDGGGGGGDSEVSHWTCSMHPSVRADAPGTCPICSMDLVPVTREEVETGTFVVDAQRRQEIGVRTAAVKIQPMAVTIRAVGSVVYDETRQSEVTVKNRGWVGRVHADETGVAVRRGQTLFELYSPELYAAQSELLTALRSQTAARSTSAPERADYLVSAARQRLRLWDLSDRQIDEVIASGEPVEYLSIRAPTSGHIVSKRVVEGAAVEPGETLYRLAGLDRVWIEAEVYESELPLVELGQRARVTLPYLPGRELEGEVSLIHPTLRGRSRTGRIRIELANPELELKPEMYANVVLVVERGERLAVPVEAVLYTGPRRIVFVDLGEGRLRPQQIEVGVRAGDDIEVLSGLEPGDVVVTSGNFLIAAESRLKSATEVWR